MRGSLAGDVEVDAVLVGHVVDVAEVGAGLHVEPALHCAAQLHQVSQ